MFFGIATLIYNASLGERSILSHTSISYHTTFAVTLYKTLTSSPTPPRP